MRLTLLCAPTYNRCVKACAGFFAALTVIAVALPATLAQQNPPPAAPAGTAAPPATSSASASQQQNAPPTIRTVTELVQLVATVTDHRHQFITDLDQQDFRVLDDGHPQKIQFFSRQTDLPLRVALLLDTSNSIRDRLNFEQDASVDFLTDVLRRHKDMAFVMTFDNEPQIVQDYSGDMDLLSRAIQKQRAGGGTALNDAIYKASQHLLDAPLPPGKDPEVRRVLVLFSDGDDNLSDHALSEALEMAQRSGVAIYSISTNTNWVAIDGEATRKLHKSHGEDILKDFSDQTGGRAFFPYSTDDLASSFQDIGTELRSQYLIAFLPENLVANGRYHTLKVETDRKGLTVRTRKGYFAPSAGSRSSKPSGSGG